MLHAHGTTLDKLELSVSSHDLSSATSGAREHFSQSLAQHCLKCEWFAAMEDALETLTQLGLDHHAAESESEGTGEKTRETTRESEQDEADASSADEDVPRAKCFACVAPSARDFEGLALCVRCDNSRIIIYGHLSRPEFEAKMNDHGNKKEFVDISRNTAGVDAFEIAQDRLPKLEKVTTSALQVRGAEEEFMPADALTDEVELKNLQMVEFGGNRFYGVLGGEKRDRLYITPVTTIAYKLTEILDSGKFALKPTQAKDMFRTLAVKEHLNRQ